jgi:predicted nucleic acid-binding protein
MSDVLLDSNVVLRLLAENDPKHVLVEEAVTKALSEGSRLVLAPQVIVESWVVMTRPSDVNGFGWEPSTTSEALTVVMKRFAMLQESPETFAKWWALVGQGVRGKRAHDARLAAVMLANGVDTILTLNGGDFSGFDGIRVIVP